METPSAYIPTDRRLAIAQDVNLPDHTSGAALFADISGFTPLTEALVRALGLQRGAEELPHWLNEVYNALIAATDAYSGSVIGFSGDAITCWFDQDDGRRATACALALQSVMEQFGSIPIRGSAPVALAIKVAVAVGPARRFLLGDPAIQLIDALAGTTLGVMAAGEHLANRGEVVLDQDVVAALGDMVIVREWRVDEESSRRYAVVSALTRPVDESPWPLLSEEAFSETQVRPWLLHPVYERLRSGYGEFLAELRPAVALFLRFEGIDYDGDPEAGRKLNAFIHRVQRVLVRHDAHLIQLTIGDKGSYLYSSFGAPVAHDDDAARAVAAALELRDLTLRSEEDALISPITNIRIGISQGRMRAGAYGGSTRRTYGVLGDEVNMAARLMGKAESGQILISQRVADAVSQYYDLQSLGAMRVKGKAEPVYVSEVRGQRAASQVGGTKYGGLLVGREAEVTRLDEILKSTIAGEGSILRLEGPAGIGKSHLAAALVEHARNWGVQVALGTSQASTQDTAYAPWRQVMRSLLGLTDPVASGDDASDSTARDITSLETLATETNPDWLLRLPLLGDLLGLPIPDNATTAAFEPRLRQSALYDLVVEMVTTWTQDQSMLLLLDDVHWMDDASRGLVVALSRALTHLPVMVALVHRPPTTDSPILPELDLLPGHQKLDLGELGPQGVAALASHRLGGEQSSLTLDLIGAISQGNPFYIEELIDNLRESGGLVQRPDGRWWLSNSLFAALRTAGALIYREGEWILSPTASLTAADLGLPDSVHAMVLARIDRLPEEIKMTLKVASVIGTTFGLDVLSQAHPLSPAVETLQNDLTILEERDFTRVEVPPHISYIFKHNVTREVAYDTLLYTQRRQLHQAVGMALETLTPDATAQLAHHFYVAEEWGRAIDYQMAAGRQGQRLFANFDAIEHFTKALQSAEHLPPNDTARQCQESNVALGELLTTVSQYDTALEHLQKALDLAVKLDDTDAQARACRWFARLYEQRGEYTKALEWIQRCLDALAGHETAETAEALVTAGLISTRQGDYAVALNQCKRSLHIAAAVGATSLMGRANGLLGIIAWKRGEGMQAIPHLLRALEIYGQAGNLHGQGLIHNIIAPIYFDLGRWADASYHYRNSREAFHQVGDLYNRALAENNIGTISRFQGRLEDAQVFFQRAMQSLDQLGGSSYFMALFHMNLGDVAVARGHVSEARHYLSICQEYIAQANAKALLPDMHRLASEIAVLARELNVAELEARQSCDIAQELGMRGDEGHALRVLGQVAAARGETEQADAALRESVAILREVGQDYGEALSQLALAQFCLTEGRVDEAQVALNHCIPVFERLEASLDLARAHALQDSIAVVS